MRGYIETAGQLREGFNPVPGEVRHHDAGVRRRVVENEQVHIKYQARVFLFLLTSREFFTTILYSLV